MRVVGVALLLLSSAHGQVPEGIVANGGAEVRGAPHAVTTAAPG